LYNAQELEACDEDGGISRSLTLISSTCRLKDMKKVSIGDRQFLFSTSGDKLTLVLRHDVDGLVWQPQISPDGKLSMDHIDSYCALGYVF
jgi:hypothetical protein